MLALTTIFVMGVGAIIITAIFVAQNCHSSVRFNVFILSRLIPALGISLGVGLMVGFSNPFVILALAATTLSVARMMFPYSFYAFKQRKQLIQEKRRKKFLIEP
jgi:hypothetical protein